mmetsp:Transcript_20806/g.29673  ORF Transcript_20806/g.29673 Transcript_20806/m.29673 type:complete len:654 (-) Transcript_20806:111-2072(-)|eukprot:CAMPEP_0172428244 /NCGR_PEP_ID=MMETSP1064-20121228/45627_1 /TAXON_ID=202472 /ORGANISM="Aulacoseira subarctica , Strain CCAP 1002/5" /LENGTH=653 /DNA_ID=CAMNT_0013172933 /DNA_START=179 /DNA_END=2140 /DNA_ORIENTATION=-
MTSAFRSKSDFVSSSKAEDPSPTSSNALDISWKMSPNGKQQQRYLTLPANPLEKQQLHEGRDDDDSTKKAVVENLQKALATKKQNVASLRSQVGVMKSKLLGACQNQITASQGCCDGAAEGKALDTQRRMVLWDETGGSLDRYFDFSNKEKQQKCVEKPEMSHELLKDRRSDFLNSVEVDHSVESNPYENHPQNPPLLENETELTTMMALRNAELTSPCGNHVAQLLSKLQESTYTIESLVNREEMNKKTIEHLRSEILNTKERMCEKLTRSEKDFEISQSENQKLTEQLSLQTDLIVSLSEARSTLQQDCDDTKNRLYKAELEVKKVESSGVRLQVELRECKIRVDELQQDLNTSGYREMQLESDVRKLQQECNAKVEEVFSQKRYIERLVKESTGARERCDFLSKELDAMLNEMKTRESDYSRIQDDHAQLVSSLKEKNSLLTEEKKQQEYTFGREIKTLEECNTKLVCQIDDINKELSCLIKQLETMTSEKALLQDKLALKEEDVRRNGIKNDALTLELRTAALKQSEAEATIEQLRSEILTLREERFKAEVENSSVVESLRKQVQNAVEEKQSTETQLHKEISELRDSNKNVLQKMQADLAEKNSMIASLQLESNMRKEKNALILSRAYQVVHGIKDKSALLDQETPAN